MSRRVSMPSIPVTAALDSASANVDSDRHDEARRDASRTANPATWIDTDSGSSWFIP